MVDGSGQQYRSPSGGRAELDYSDQVMFSHSGALSGGADRYTPLSRNVCRMRKECDMAAGYICIIRQRPMMGCEWR